MSTVKRHFSLIAAADGALYWLGWLTGIGAMIAFVTNVFQSPIGTADEAKSAFEAFGMMAGLALAATALIIAGTPAHQKKLEVFRAWNHLINAIVLNTAAWAAATFLALAGWFTGSKEICSMSAACAVLAGFWGIRGYWWACMAITKFRKIT